jgi:hypothetical protein
VYSPDAETHKTHVCQVLERLLQHQLYVKAEKCAFDQKEVTFLGFVISADGMRMDPAKTASIRDWIMPTSLSKLRSFLGFTNFYCRFIPNYCILASPLTSLTSTSKPFLWNDEATKAFNELKQVLQSDLVLRYPDYSQPFVVQTDASDGGLERYCFNIINQSRSILENCLMPKLIMRYTTRNYWQLCQRFLIGVSGAPESRQLGKSY